MEYHCVILKSCSLGFKVEHGLVSFYTTADADVTLPICKSAVKLTIILFAVRMNFANIPGSSCTLIYFFAIRRTKVGVQI